MLSEGEAEYWLGENQESAEDNRDPFLIGRVQLKVQARFEDEVYSANGVEDIDAGHTLGLEDRINLQVEHLRRQLIHGLKKEGRL